MEKNCAIILAAGKGKRMGMHQNKQFLEMMNKPLLAYTLETFSRNQSIHQIVLVGAKKEIENCKQLVKRYKIEKVIAIVEGGEERQDSVLNGLETIKDCNIVLIHDGARPFVSDKIIEDGIKYAKLYKAAACGVVPKDTIKSRDEQGFSTGTYSRNDLFSVQTPQCFDYAMILNCHKRAAIEGLTVTDDTMIAEQYGNKIYLYEGSYTNIKITTPEDISIGEKILEVENRYNSDK